MARSRPPAGLALWLLLVLAADAAHPRVLLVSFDGFRWDYLRLYNASWFHRAAASGATTTDGSYNATFTTKSFPGHFTIATGLYEETHGIIDNTMYDPKNGAKFSLRNKTAQRDPFWWNAEPIWITAERTGKRAGTFFWPGSEVPYNGMRQKFWKIFDSSMPFLTRVDSVVRWLTKEDVSFATLYFEEPDLSGHAGGPFSNKTRDAVEKMNAVLGYLIRRLKEEKIYDSVNLVLTSDHGLSNCSKGTVVSMHKVLYPHRALISRIISFGTVFGLNARPGKSRELYNAISQASQQPAYSMVAVYNRSSIPPRFHYSSNRRIPDVLLLAKEGYFLLPRPRRRPKAIPAHFGCHGYDNALPSMRPFFIARGPRIHQGVRIPPFRQVDIYNLLARLLEVKPRPNNGTWANVEKMYKVIAPVYGNVFSSSSEVTIFPKGILLTVFTVTFLLKKFEF